MTDLKHKLMLTGGQMEAVAGVANNLDIKRESGPGPLSLSSCIAPRFFTPCTLGRSLLEAVSDTGFFDVSGDKFLPLPACSIFDEFRDYQQFGDVHCHRAKSISWGSRTGTPNRMVGKRITERLFCSETIILTAVN
jgi:hypothetical protein